MIAKPDPKPAKIWTVEFDDRARRELRKLDAGTQQTIRYLRQRIATHEDPRRFGKPLRRNLAGLWRYRIDDYRIICRIEDDHVVVLVLQVGHRREIYDEANAPCNGQVTVNDSGFRSPTASHNGERHGADSPAPVVRDPL